MSIIYTKCHIAVMCMMCDMQKNVIYMYIPTYRWRNSNVIITPNVIATLFWRNGGVDFYIMCPGMVRRTTISQCLIARESN